MTAVLIMARVAVLLAILVLAGNRPLQEETLLRFHDIAAEAGVPYRDFPVEYPPLEFLVIRGVAGSTLPAAAQRLAIVSFGCDLLVFATLRRVWGTQAGLVYLALGLPLLAFAYFRLDLLSVAAATLGIALARKNYQRSGGIVLAAAALSKIWPLVLLPILLISRKWRALWWSLGSLAILLGVWIRWSGGDAITQVLGFRGARGWEVESTVGSIIWTFSSGAVHVEKGAPRIGVAPPWANALAFLLLAAGIAAVWMRARRDAVAPETHAAAAVAMLLALAPVLSPQYVLWLLPWAAIATAGRQRRVASMVFAIATLTAALYVLYAKGIATSAPWIVQSMLLARNAGIISVALLGLRRMKPVELPGGGASRS